MANFVLRQQSKLYPLKLKLRLLSTLIWKSFPVFLHTFHRLPLGLSAIPTQTLCCYLSILENNFLWMGEEIFRVVPWSNQQQHRVKAINTGQNPVTCFHTGRRQIAWLALASSWQLKSPQWESWTHAKPVSGHQHQHPRITVATLQFPAGGKRMLHHSTGVGRQDFSQNRSIKYHIKKLQK